MDDAVLEAFLKTTKNISDTQGSFPKNNELGDVTRGNKVLDNSVRLDAQKRQK